jgi:hypothetical protein
VITGFTVADCAEMIFTELPSPSAWGIDDLGFNLGLDPTRH